MSIVGYAHPKNFQEYLQRVNELDSFKGKRITFEEFANFNKALKHLHGRFCVCV